MSFILQVSNTYLDAEKEVSINDKMSGFIISLLCSKLIIFLTKRHWFVSVDIKNMHFVIGYNFIVFRTFLVSLLFAV
jgi:hypothetical protein